MSTKNMVSWKEGGSDTVLLSWLRQAPCDPVMQLPSLEMTQGA